MKRIDQRGFTLPEVLVVIGVLIVLLAASILFVRPTSYDKVDNDASRRLGLAALAQGIKDFHGREGNWPANLPDEATAISDQPDGYDLCRQLVPGYLQDMTFDPEAGLAYTGTPEDPMPSLDACNDPDVGYTTGFTIQQNTDTSVLLIAPLAATGRIEITVR